MSRREERFSRGFGTEGCDNKALPFNGVDHACCLSACELCSMNEALVAKHVHDTLLLALLGPRSCSKKCNCRMGSALLHCEEQGAPAYVV
mmetsp:Transcript_58541/g.131685  ORF Transcript_58541/g.131685 Transcript_58541/m.131685 type:complete len:90 (+) Transcript_58541:171-440(+)